MANIDVTIAGEGPIAFGEMELSVNAADVAIAGDGPMASADNQLSVNAADVAIAGESPMATAEMTMTLTETPGVEVTENAAGVFGLGPLAEGDNQLTLDEIVDTTLAGQGPQATAENAFSVLTLGDRAPYNTLRHDELLAGVRHFVRGPGVYVAAGTRRSRRILILDTSSPRTIQIARRTDRTLAVTEELPGEVHALERTDDYLFAYLFDGVRRWVEIRSNTLALDKVLRFEVTRSEAEGARWLALEPQAEVFAYPNGLGEVDLRRTTDPFDLIGRHRLGFSISAFALWTRLRVQERDRLSDFARIKDQRYFLHVIPERGIKGEVYEYRKTSVEDFPEVDTDVVGTAPMAFGEVEGTVV